MSERYNNYYSESDSSLNPGTNIRVRELTPELLIRNKNQLEYIINPSGDSLSDGFYEISVYQYQDEKNLVNIILARVGAMNHILSPVIEESGTLFFYPVGEGFHKISFRPDLDNQFVARTGAMNYLLDQGLEKSHQIGYHSICRDSISGKYYGKIGKFEEPIKFITNH